MRIRFTLFHFLVIVIILLAGFAAWLQIENWRLSQSLVTPAPGHAIIEAEEETLRVVMIYDYLCPFCYTMDAPIREAAVEDGNVTLVFKFVPFLGEASGRLARIAFAAGEQGKFIEFHDFMMTQTPQGAANLSVEDIAEGAGLDLDRLSEDSESDAASAKVQENFELSMTIGADSTPTFLIGSMFYLPDSMPDKNRFLALFDEARQME